MVDTSSVSVILTSEVFISYVFSEDFGSTKFLIFLRRTKKMKNVNPIKRTIMIIVTGTATAIILNGADVVFIVELGSDVEVTAIDVLTIVTFGKYSEEVMAAVGVKEIMVESVVAVAFSILITDGSNLETQGITSIS